MGLITAGGLLAPIHGLNPFVNSAYASGGTLVAAAYRPAHRPAIVWRERFFTPMPALMWRLAFPIL